LIAIAKDVFDTHMPESNQINKKKNNFNVEVSREDLTCVPVGTCTEKCLRDNINIGYTYLKSWLDGNGCVPINNLMEDAATAEISRAQIWQWIQNEVTLDTGFKVTKEYFQQVFLEEIEKYEYDKLTEDIFREICTSIHLEDFLTTACYKHI
jgi:malate synthase